MVTIARPSASGVLYPPRTKERAGHNVLAESTHVPNATSRARSIDLPMGLRSLTGFLSLVTIVPISLLWRA